MKITINQFAAFKGLSLSSASKLYKTYLTLLKQPKKKHITVFDLAKIEDLPVSFVCAEFGYKSRNLALLNH